MTIRIAINGMGRIGRCIFRAVSELRRDDIELVAINGPAPIEKHVHLLKYDSVHGRFPIVKAINEDSLDAGLKNPVKLFREKDPLKIPWGDLGVDIVMECTGKFCDNESASMHLSSGAKKVIISTATKDPDITVVYSVNHKMLTKDHNIISIGSCTTNCLAPVVKVINDSVGIDRGFMTTIHAYTNDQSLVDRNHRDLRRARAAAKSIIPSSTGAAAAISKVIPEMEGKLDGAALRVPVDNVSAVDLTFESSKKTSIKEINEMFLSAAKGDMRGVLAYNNEELVSIDFNHTIFSSVYDSTLTRVVDDKFCRVLSWYDNEWSYAVRMLDIASYIGKKIL